jgi:hypothetical protein
VPAFKEVNALLKEWYPRAEELVVPDAGHVSADGEPSAVAQGLARFYIGQRGTK